MTAPVHTVASLLTEYLAELEARFWRHVVKTDHCWVWQRGRNLAGYGALRIGNHGILAHRFSYETQVGSIPKGLTLDHLCRNRACVNPAHLEPVTSAVNTQRGVHNDYQRSKTHCAHGHLFDEANTYVWRDGSRQCRTCGRQRKAVYAKARRPR